MNELDIKRKNISKNTSDESKALLGQYLTPCTIADFMASLFSSQEMVECSILDPGAGMGVLAATLANRMIEEGKQKISSISAVEIDDHILSALRETLSPFDVDGKVVDIERKDFIETALDWIQFEPQKRFSHIIMNPPYKKINSNSNARKLLREVGVETVNLYSGFMALCLMLLKEHGELVAIIPRSFCNGPYYKSFRKMIFERVQIKHIHLFKSRKGNFQDDGVLQENVILKIQNDIPEEHEIKISCSEDANFKDYREYFVSSKKVINDDDPETFIRIPEEEEGYYQHSAEVSESLETLGITVSTGPVVAFRAKPFLLKQVKPGAVPLIHPLHFHLTHCRWPQENPKKPNGILKSEETEKMLFPSGYYCAVKRFSAKEEKRRITACVITPDDFPNMDYLGFENHLNVFHHHKKGIDKNLAFGLMVFLNSKMVDEFFRTFNGHTQVNAMDLKQILYPSTNSLTSLGIWAQSQDDLTLEKIDKKVEETLCKKMRMSI